ncbi:MAG: hypothetical protein GEU97_13755 [Actinophytocola sp.]|nr:hypothetical protein [Actinophytocola sp.]
MTTRENADVGRGRSRWRWWWVPLALVTASAVAVVLFTAVGGGEPAKPLPPVKTLPSSGKWSGTTSAYPVPGMSTALPRTEIAFRDVPRDERGQIAVEGARSGKHKGRIVDHPDGEGFSFVPKGRFHPGEEVRVSTDLAVRGDDDGDFTFTIARKFHDPVSSPSGPPQELTPEQAANYQKFATRPDLLPPKIDVVQPSGSKTSDGLIFHTPKDRSTRADQEGPMIVDDQGEVVWFRPLNGKRAADFKVSEYRGEKVLLWWQGQIRHSHGPDRVVILDERYETVARVTPTGYDDIDGHEVLLTPRGTALMLIKNPVMWDVPGDDRGKRPVIDCVLQEVDVETGRVLFEWHSLGNIDVNETYAKSEHYLDRPWDWLHANSIEVDENGDFLISARHTSAVYKIDRETGRVIWRLGGQRSDFEMGPGTTFSFQHDARVRPDGTITILDNAHGAPDPPDTDVSRGIVLRLDREKAEATLVREYREPNDGMSTAEANMQDLPDGNVFIGWGTNGIPGYSEYTHDGELVYDARLPESIESYRSYRFPWRGRPTSDPAIEVRDGKRVYASWNGATDVDRWQVLAGPSRQTLRPIATASRDGFETRIDVATKAKFIAVRAKDADGKTLGTSSARRR